jgi:hypothetical protein
MFSLFRDCTDKKHRSNFLSIKAHGVKNADLPGVVATLLSLSSEPYPMVRVNSSPAKPSMSVCLYYPKYRKSVGS